ncbi:MAG: arsenate reductase ArsC [Gammaproteobacteria bacterium]|nr:arsenate reductase ArsC [Gammaproteobacteria bacterium]
MNILFVCTHNRCRSILCEAVVNYVAGDSIKAFSAGSQPEGRVHPMSLERLDALGIPTTNLQSQSWDEFDDHAIDLVITVCDSAAGESCPLWLGNTPKVHWGLPDPSKLSVSKEAQAQAFDSLIRVLMSRANRLIDLPNKQLSSQQLIEACITIANLEPI